VALDTARFVCEAADKRRQGLNVDEIVRPYLQGEAQYPLIPGYSRPLLKGVDERVVHMERVATELGYEPGWCLQVCNEISDFLYEEYEEGINLAGYTVAFLLDAGLTPTEIQRVTAMAVMAGVHACYAEAADRPPYTFLPLRCDDIDYQGVPERPVPDPN
jgi:citrate synthase